MFPNAQNLTIISRRIIIILQCILGTRPFLRYYDLLIQFSENERWTAMKPKRALQESIPARCVPPASVATTRCQHCRCTLQGKVYLLGGGVPARRVYRGCTMIYPPNEGTYYQEYIPPGTWYQACPSPVDRHMPVKTLPSSNFVGGR